MYSYTSTDYTLVRNFSKKCYCKNVQNVTSKRSIEMPCVQLKIKIGYIKNINKSEYFVNIQRNQGSMPIISEKQALLSISEPSQWKNQWRFTCCVRKQSEAKLLTKKIRKYYHLAITLNHIEMWSSCMKKSNILPDYHQMHHKYHHMAFQVCGKKSGPQIPDNKSSVLLYY